MKPDLLSCLENQVGIITFNRPKVHNALSTAMWQALPELIDNLKAAGAALIIFRGVGRSFAAGADFSELKAINDFEDAARIWDSIDGALSAVSNCPLPTVALIQGPCLGGGCLLATACDIRLATPEALFGIPVARLGLKLNRATVERLTALIGPGQSRRLLFTGDTIDSITARDIGLVEEIISSQQMEQWQALPVINQTLANGREAIGSLKQALLALPTQNQAQLKAEREEIIASYLTAEFKKRLAALK